MLNEKRSKTDLHCNLVSATSIAGVLVATGLDRLKLISMVMRGLMREDGK